MQLRLFDAFSKTKGNFLLASELRACFVRATLNTVRSFSTTTALLPLLRSSFCSLVALVVFWDY